MEQLLIIISHLFSDRLVVSKKMIRRSAAFMPNLYSDESQQCCVTVVW